MKNETTFALPIVAVLSSTVIPTDGIYRIERVEGDKRERVLRAIKGVPHYVGHPATRTIVEELGAVKAETNLFEGLPEPWGHVHAVAVALPIKQGRSTRSVQGFTAHQDVMLDDLDVVLIERLHPLCQSCTMSI